MKLTLTSLKRHSKTFMSVKQTGHPLYQNLYFDFENQQIVGANNSERCSTPFEFSDSLAVKPKNMFVDATQLLTVLSSMTSDVLIFDELKNVFLEGSNKYKLAFRIEDMEYPKFEADSSDENYESLVLSNEFSQCVRESVVFADQNENSPLNGVFFYKGRLVATNRREMYEHVFDLLNSSMEFNVPLSVTKHIQSIGSSEFSLIKDSSKILLKTDGLSMYFNLMYDLKIPDVTSDKFKELYDNQNYIEVDTQTLLNEISFLNNFAKAEKDQRIIFKVEEDADNTVLVLKIVGDDVEIDRTIGIVSCSDKNYFTKEFWLVASFVKSIVSTFASKEVKTIKLFVDHNKPVVNFKSDSYADLHIISALISQG